MGLVIKIVCWKKVKTTTENHNPFALQQNKQVDKYIKEIPNDMAT